MHGCRTMYCCQGGLSGVYPWSEWILLSQQPLVSSRFPSGGGIHEPLPCPCWDSGWFDLMQTQYWGSRMQWPHHPQQIVAMPISTASFSYNLCTPIFHNHRWALNTGHVETLLYVTSTLNNSTQVTCYHTVHNITLSESSNQPQWHKQQFLSDLCHRGPIRSLESFVLSGVIP